MYCSFFVHLSGYATAIIVGPSYFQYMNVFKPNERKIQERKEKQPLSVVFSSVVFAAT